MSVVGVSEWFILSAVSVSSALRTTLSSVWEAAESASLGLLREPHDLEKSFRKHIHGNDLDVVGSLNGRDGIGQMGMTDLQER